MNSTRLNIENNKFINKELDIYGQNGPLTTAIGQVLSLFEDLFKGIIFLVANDENAIKEVLEIMTKNPKQNLIIFAPDLITSSTIYGARTELTKLMKYPRVRILEKITTFLPDACILAEELKKIDGLAEIETKEISRIQKESYSRILSILKHDLKPYVIEEKGDRYNKILKEARDVFDIKPETSDENVVSFILNTETKINKVMDGDISGVYCDIDDTIIGSDGKVIGKTLEIIQELEKQGKEIIIWTGGDLVQAKKKLEGTPFEKYKLVSKYDYSGASAEIIIDNTSPEKFFIQTGITAKKFIRI